ncbi:MAG: DEAD/DEAH box helicase [Bacteroidia bacterium]
MEFTEFNLHPDLQEGVLSMNYKSATKIQEQAIPVILSGKDLIACAQTGTGKTAAFLIPCIQHILISEKRHLNTLIIAPTRELALQIDQQIDGLGYFCGVSSIAIYGGNDGMAWETQRHALKEGVDIIVATPGRLIALLQNGSINFEHLQHLILDEADRMLDMGFIDDIQQIASYLPKNRQTILFSATMPAKIRKLASLILKEPEQINIAISKPAERVKQAAYMVYDSQKLGLLEKILNDKDVNSAIVFASTKDKVKQIDRALQKTGLKLKAFHSDLDQPTREEIMRNFKSKQLPVLIGTDIISRGIDVDGIDLVVNYDVPPDPEDYIHRIGRTARASKEGRAITFITEDDQLKFLQIEDLMGIEVEKLKLGEELGKQPEYNTVKKSKSKNFKNFKKGNFRRQKPK